MLINETNHLLHQGYCYQLCLWEIHQVHKVYGLTFKNSLKTKKEKRNMGAVLPFPLYNFIKGDF